MSTDCPKKKLPRPEFYGHFERQIKRNLALAIGSGITAGTLFYFFYARKKKLAYENYHKTLDPDALFEEMRQNDLFSACPM